MKQLDLNKTVYELTNEYPEVKDIMVELGFKDITSPAAMNFMGRVMTIPKGALIKGISMDKVVETFENNGFEVKGYTRQHAEVILLDDAEDRNAKLKKLILRLNQGEDLESVRADFVKDFESVSVHDIVKAEQGLIDDGVPMNEVQRLCDLHSALFHGKTEAELWAEEEAELNDSKDIRVEKGHPVDILRRENKALEAIIEKAEEHLAKDDVEDLVYELKILKKIDILYRQSDSTVLDIRCCAVT